MVTRRIFELTFAGAEGSEDVMVDGEADVLGEYGARSSSSLSTGGRGGATMTKIVCTPCGIADDRLASIVAFSGAGSVSPLQKRRRCDAGRDGSRGNTESITLGRASIC